MDDFIPPRYYILINFYEDFKIGLSIVYTPNYKTHQQSLEYVPNKTKIQCNHFEFIFNINVVKLNKGSGAIFTVVYGFWFCLNV